MKVFSILAPFKGSAGNITFSHSNGQTIGRQKVTSVRNPKTDAQIFQRAKLLPARLTYARLDEVLNHSFVAAGAPLVNRSRFMSYAMKAGQFPYLPKGYDSTAVPGRYKVSDGIYSSCVDSCDKDAIITRFQIASGVTGLSSENLVAANDDLEMGDQLTFIMVCMNSEGDPRWFYNRVVLAPSAQFPEGFALRASTLVVESLLGGDDILAGAVILTKNTNGKYVYSDEFFNASTLLYDMYQQPSDYERMMSSYRNLANTSGSTKYLQQAGTQPASGSAAGVGAQMQVELPWQKGESSGTILVTGLVRNDGLYLLVESTPTTMYPVDSLGNRITVMAPDATELTTAMLPTWTSNFKSTWYV